MCPPGFGSKRWTSWCFALCVACTGASDGPQSGGSAAEAEPELLGEVTQASASQPVKAINCGVTSGFTRWYAGDEGLFSGGTSSPPAGSIDTTKTYYPAPAEVYRSLRYGNMTYTIPGLTPNAKYVVRLHFAERTPGFNAVGARVFDVSINGSLVLDNYDIFADAGFQVAVVKPFNATANGTGRIVIELAGVVQSAVINAIEVLPGSAYSINAGSNARAGAYQPDQYASAGSGVSTTNNIDNVLVQNPPPQAVLRAQRTHSASFDYRIPGLVAGQRYNVRLYFAELAKTAAGQRTFDVRLNGTRVLFRYDPFDAGGGRFRASERSFEAVANAAGEIVIGLERVVDNPVINAIDVAPQVTYKFDAGGFGVAPFDPDQVGYLSGATDTLVTSSPIVVPAGTAGPAPAAVYQTARRAAGSMAYTLEALLPGKLYHVRLHFAEIDPAKFQVGARKFDVRLNDVLILDDFDIFAAAGNAGDKLVIKELTFYADTFGRLKIGFANAVGSAIINAIEVERELHAPGYHATHLGAVGAPATVHGRDGAVSALIGDKVLWFFGDTGMAATDGSTTPPNVSWWMNTAGLSDKRTPWILTEALDSGGRPRGQMVPFIASQFDYNRAHFGAGWGCSAPCDGTYYAQWPGSVIRELNGNALVFSGNGLIDLDPPEPGAPPSVGVVTFVQPAGALPTNDSPVATQNVLFPISERQFGNAFVANDGYVYAYTWEQGTLGTLAAPLSSGVSTNSLALKGRLSSSLMPGQTVELHSGANRQIVSVSSTALEGASTVSVQPFVPNFSYPVDAGVFHPGCPIGRLSSALNAGVAYTSVSLSNGLPAAVSAGQSIEVWSGANVLSLTASASAAAGATAVGVQTFTPARSYAAGSQVNQSVSNVFTPPSFVARAPLAPLGNAAIRASWRFWNQRLNGFAGGWDVNIASGTPMLYTDGSRNWVVSPSVSFNPYLNKYLGIRGALINADVLLTTADRPQGPWTPEITAARANTPIGTFGNYFMVQHAELSLSSGQQIYVTHSHGSGKNYILQITLP